MLARYRHLEAIPVDAKDWDVTVRGAEKLADTLVEHHDEALLYRHLTTLDPTAPVMSDVNELAWSGPLSHLGDLCAHLDAPRLAERATTLANRLS